MRPITLITHEPPCSCSKNMINKLFFLSVHKTRVVSLQFCLQYLVKYLYYKSRCLCVCHYRNVPTLTTVFPHIVSSLEQFPLLEQFPHVRKLFNFSLHKGNESLKVSSLDEFKKEQLPRQLYEEIRQSSNFEAMGTYGFFMT